MISSSVSVVSLPEYFLIMSSLVVSCFLSKLFISLLVSVPSCSVLSLRLEGLASK